LENAGFREFKRINENNQQSAKKRVDFRRSLCYSNKAVRHEAEAHDAEKDLKNLEEKR